MKSLQLDSPYLILMVGIPGSGKTYFAKQFSELFFLPIIDGSRISNREVFDYLLPEFLKTSKSIVVDSDTLAKKTREEYYNLAKKAGYKIMTVWVQTDTETSKKRTDKNNKLRAFSVNFEHELNRFTLPGESEKPVVISGKHTFATQTKVVLSKLIQPRVNLASLQIKRIRG